MGVSLEEVRYAFVSLCRESHHAVSILDVDFLQPENLEMADKKSEVCQNLISHDNGLFSKLVLITRCPPQY